MSYLDKTKLTQTGWKFGGRISGYRNQNGNIMVYNDSSCRPSFVIGVTISKDMSLTRSLYCKLSFTETLPNEPCLYMFVAYNEQCQIQVELHGLRNHLSQGVVKIVEDNTNFTNQTFPSISKSVAVALENNQQSVYLYYWPLEQAFLYARRKFLIEYSNPIWSVR